MADPIKVEIRGLAELRDALKTVPIKVEEKIIRQGLYAAASVIRREVRARAPVRADGRSLELSTGKRKSKFYQPGYLKASFRIRLGKEDGLPVAWVHSGRAFYGHFYEFGTHHQPARPFFRPAVEAAKGPAFRAMTETMTVKFGETFQGSVRLPTIAPALTRG